MKNSHPYLVRTLALGLAMLIISTVLLTRLAYLQVRQELSPQTAASAVSSRSYTEHASRGEIFDRNGVPLVSNTLGFNLELDYYNWDRANQNAVILALCQILDEAGIDYSDHKDILPITDTVPFAYTYTSEESRSYRTLAKYIGQQEDWPEDPPASTLFTLLCQKYKVDEELGVYAKRTIVGVRYYLDIQQFSEYNNPVTLAENVDIATVAKISELSMELPGVTIQVDDIRQYDTTYAAHILGRVSAISAEEYAQLKDQGYKLNDNLGTEGMEQALEGYLRGIDGTRVVEVSKATGQVVQEYMREDPNPGGHCYLTIDLELQQVAEDALAATLAEVKRRGEASRDGKGADVEGGALVVLDVNTGEVLAMASYPTYNLTTYAADLVENNQNSLAPLYNRAIKGAYPPGSTYKMVTALAALEERLVTPEDKIRDEGVFTKYDSPQPKCWIYNRSRTTHGNINISEALKYSCNYYFYVVGDKMGINTLNQYAAMLGLGEKTGIELAGEAAGNLDGPEARAGETGDWAWYDGITLSVAIGQAGQQLTPLQLANYVATIINGGTRYQPHLLKEVRDYTGSEVIYAGAPVVQADLTLMPSTIKAIKDGMYGVVTEDGTASSYFRNFPSSIGVGGKTGSAETYGTRSAHGVFVSFAPFDEPEIVVVAIGEYAGSGGIMSPACIEIYNHYFGLNEEPEPETAPTESTGNPAPPDSAQTLPQSTGDEPDTQTEPDEPQSDATTDPTAPETDGEAAPPPAEPSEPTEPEAGTEGEG